MPIILVKLFEGRTTDQKRDFAVAVTNDAVQALKCAPEAVEVIFEDVKKSDWATAGRLASDKR